MGFAKLVSVAFVNALVSNIALDLKSHCAMRGWYADTSKGHKIKLKEIENRGMGTKSTVIMNFLELLTLV